MVRKPLALVVWVAVACGPPVPTPDAGAAASSSVSFEPSADAAHVPSVVHLHIASSSLSSGSVSLFQGTLSSYYLGKVQQGELPDTLAARRVPLVSFRVEGELVAAPLQPLALGPYSLVSRDGLLAAFDVSTTQPLLTRLWPPANALGGLRLAVYCADNASSLSLPQGDALLLEPRALSVTPSPGVDETGAFGDRCVHFSSEVLLDSSEILVPAPVLGTWALGQSLFGAVPSTAVVPLSCREGEVALGLACATIADDRAVLRTPLAPLFWVVHTSRGSLVQATRAGASLTIPGLAPGSREHLWGNTHDESGATRAFDVTIDTAAPRERPILNEALADALGPEPQSEWIEIFNDGTLAVDLAHYSVQDGGGKTALPHAWLASKEYVLLVRDDYAPSSSDVPPPASARLLRVPTLGKSGLSNSGERLALVDREGIEGSVLPALAGKPGQSLARRTPSARDDEPDAFSFGPPTPGFSNEAGP